MGNGTNAKEVKDKTLAQWDGINIRLDSVKQWGIEVKRAVLGRRGVGGKGRIGDRR